MPFPKTNSFHPLVVCVCEDKEGEGVKMCLTMAEVVSKISNKVKKPKVQPDELYLSHLLLALIARLCLQLLTLIGFKNHKQSSNGTL